MDRPSSNFSLSNRGPCDAKDAVDFYALLRSYGGAGNFERTIDLHQAWDRFFSLDCDEEKTGAWLMGVVAARIASPETMISLWSILSESSQRERLIDGMASDHDGTKEWRSKAEELLGLFVDGMVHEEGTSTT